jgi:dTDP-4-dehydrorhamnose reductase
MKNKEILILGRGMIGTKLHEELNCPVSEKKIAVYEDVEALIQEHRPKVIINCIGHTGKNNVDDCELALDKTVSANTFVPILLGEAAYRNNIKLVHVSSGCIFHYDYKKNKPISESQTPDFFDLYYSRTKIYAENILLSLAKRANILILRIRVPLDNQPGPKNTFTKLINFKTIIDVPNSVTYLPEFVKAVQFLLKKDARGLYNIVCKGGLRYSKLLNEYKKYHPETEYKVIELKDLKRVRTNLVLSPRKLEREGFKVRTVDQTITDCVKQYVKNEQKQD